MLGAIAKGMKDGALGLAIKAYLNDRLKDYGDVLDCSVDTRKGRIALKALLKGDKEPITASVEKYELVREGGDVYAIVKSFSSSKVWLTLLLTKLFSGKRYKLPGAVGGLL